MNSKDNHNLKIFIFAITLIFVCLFCFGYEKYSNLQNEIDTYKNEISIKDRKIAEYKEYKNQISTYQSQIDFMNKFVAICPSDGSGLYHKYNCTHYDKSDNFYIFNISNANNEGFEPCYYCQSDNTVEETNSEMVYVTDTGSKYHRSTCSYLRSKNPIAKEKAIKQGYSACSRCNP